MLQYDVEAFTWHGDKAGFSWHNVPKLTEALNKRAGNGWRLVQMQPVSNGYLLVFETEGYGRGM